MRLLLLLTFLIVVSCGNHSEIDPLVGARPIGKNGKIKKTYLYPLSEDTITRYEDPTLDDGLISKWINKAGYNLASWFGMAKVKVEMTYPLPHVDTTLLTEVKIKKIFLTLEEVPCTEELEKLKKCKMTDFTFRKNKKKKKENFDFLNSAIVRLEKNPQQTDYNNDDADITTVSSRDYKKLLKKRRKGGDWDKDPNAMEIAIYDEKADKPQFYTNVVIIKNSNSFELKKYIKSKRYLSRYIDNIVSTQGYLYVELRKIDYYQKKFLYFLETDPELEDVVTIHEIQDCSKNNCLVLNVNNDNLINFLRGEKNVFIQTYFDLQKVPTKMFQIRGYALADYVLNIDI